MKPTLQFTKYLILIVISLQFISCEPEEINDDQPSASSSFTGTWVRILGPSGDETDLAIGVVEGDPNRVFMCEKVGSTAAGFYKGNLSGNTIVWDANHGLPNTKLRIVGSQLEFHYASVAGSLPTLYDRGSWSAECGTLTLNNNGGGSNTGGNTGGSTTTGQAAFWVQSDLGCGNITVVINGTSRTISQYYTSNPNCNGSGSANFELSAGTYSYSASCSGYTWEGSISVSNGQCSTMQLTL